MLIWEVIDSRHSGGKVSDTTPDRPVCVSVCVITLVTLVTHWHIQEYPWLTSSLTYSKLLSISYFYWLRALWSIGESGEVCTLSPLCTKESICMHKSDFICDQGIISHEHILECVMQGIHLNCFTYAVWYVGTWQTRSDSQLIKWSLWPSPRRGQSSGQVIDVCWWTIVIICKMATSVFLCMFFLVKSVSL